MAVWRLLTNASCLLSVCPPQFLESVLETNLQEADESPGSDEKASPPSGNAGGGRDVSMAELMNDHKLDISFNYGGSSISAAEMSVSPHEAGMARLLSNPAFHRVFHA